MRIQYNMAELGARIMNLDQLVASYTVDGEKGFGVVFDYGHDSVDLLGYPNERERNLNFKRIENWLLDYPPFASVQNKIFNLTKLQYLHCSGTILVVNLVGKQFKCSFNSPTEAAEAYTAIGRLVKANVK